MSPAFHLVTKYRRSRYKTLQEFPVTAFASYEKGGRGLCLLEVFGPLAEVNRISPSLRHVDDCQLFFGGNQYNVAFSKKSDIQTARSHFPNRSGVLQTFFASDPNDRLIPIFSRRYREIAFEISRHLLLPMLPNWAGWVVATLFENKLLLQTDAYGIDAVMLVNDRDKVSQVLSELIRDKRLLPGETTHTEADPWKLRSFAERRRDWIRRHFAPRLFNSRPFVDEPARVFLLNRSIDADQILFEHQTGQGRDVSVKSNRKAISDLGKFAREGGCVGETFSYVTTHVVAGRTVVCKTEGTVLEVQFDPASGVSVDKTFISIRS